MTTTKTKQPSVKKLPLERIGKVLPWVLIICGVIGIIASVTLTIDTFDALQNPNFHPACDLNPIVSCGSVMESSQANVFGFMNPLIGLLGFPVVVTIGAAMLAGAQFKRWWFWRGMQLGLTLGVVFAYWLLFQSIYRIGALCPYCLSVDVALTTAFWYVTLYNLREGNLALPDRLKTAGEFAKRHHVDILIFWFLIVIAVILQHFWYYYGQYV